jgi:cell division initiation protein
MPEEHMAADEHALIRQVTEPLERVPYHPLEDVAAPDFPAALRGYDRAAVDAYVARVAQLVAELEATRVPEAAIKRALERVGEETAGVLTRAHETAEEIVSRSRAEAEERLDRARAEAEQIVGAARESLTSIDRDTDRVWAERTKLLEDTKRLADEMLAVADGGLERFPAEEPHATQRIEEPPATQGIEEPPATQRIEDQPTQILEEEAVEEHDLAADVPQTEPIEPPSPS